MTAAPEPRTARAIARSVLSGRMLVVALMGFVSGLPLLLTGSVLQAWMKDEGVDLTTIGLFALVGLPYTLKFAWAPLFDRFVPLALGRRRGWLLLLQIALIGALVLLAQSSPGVDPFGVAAAALLVTFFSASQDIVVDAYRREVLADDEQGLGASLAVNGYRLGMLLASGGGLILADHWAFPTVYLFMACCMLVGVATTLLAAEPGAPAGRPRSLREAVIDPFVDYFRRPDSVAILLFIVLYKVGDAMAASMTTPFYLDIGFSKTEIGAVVKLFGTWATVVGGFAGGLIVLRLGIVRPLWGFGVLQGLSTAGFALLAVAGPDLRVLTAVIAFENLSGGLGTSAYVAFMATLTNRRFTATQYALLSSLMGIPRVLVAVPTGWLAAELGWVGFFLLCTVAALPGLWVLGWLLRRGTLRRPAEVPA